jgi:ABC-type multidrug transport system fused ATPase/permease subunit
MDLKEAWKKLEREKLNKPVSGAVEVRKTSKHPVQKLILLFKITLGFAIFFDLFFIYLLLITPQLIVTIFLVIMIIVYLFFFIINYRILKDIQYSFRLDQNLKGTLQQVFDNTMSTLAFQRKSSLFIYPFAATAGFLLGLSVEADAAVMMQKWQVILALIISIIILTPACYYLARWMEKVSYGKYLNQLRDLIQQFEKDEAESI